MTKDKETPFFDGFDLPEDENNHNITENDYIPAMEWLDQMIHKVDIIRVSPNKNQKQKAVAAQLTEYLEFMKKLLLESIKQDKREDYEELIGRVWSHIMDFRIFLNMFARPVLNDAESVNYIFQLCSKMEQKLKFMRPLHESTRKRLPKTLKAHFAKMPECAKKYYPTEINALEEL